MLLAPLVIERREVSMALEGLSQVIDAVVLRLGLAGRSGHLYAPRLPAPQWTVTLRTHVCVEKLIGLVWEIILSI